MDDDDAPPPIEESKTWRETWESLRKEEAVFIKVAVWGYWMICVVLVLVMLAKVFS